MRITVNNRAIEIFAGARVGDVLLKYSRAEWSAVRRRRKIVTDRHGQEVGLDGELNGGEELIIQARPDKESRS